MESQTWADPAVSWIRARQLCYLGGHVPQSGEIVGIPKKPKDSVPTDLADLLKADEEERRTDKAPLVGAQQWEEERQKNRAEELRSRSLLRRSSPLSVRGFLWPSRDVQRRGCCWLVNAQATGGRTTAPRFLFMERTNESTTCVPVSVILRVSSMKR